MSISVRRLSRAATPPINDLVKSPYDLVVLADTPVAYWTLGQSNGLVDYTGHGHAASAVGGSLVGTMPTSGETSTVLNGSTQYIEIADAADLSVPASGILTIEAWVRPDVLEFPHSEGTGYVHWLGKGELGQHEYAARLYNLTNSEQRPNRLSGYAFNLSGGLGAGSYEQDAVTVGEWIHYTLIINTVATSGSYPTGYTKLYKNGVQRDQDSLSGYSIVPGNGSAPLRLGTRDFASYFQGAIAKVAVYDYELSATQLLTHYQEMVSPGQIVNVSSASQLTSALSNAQPGQTILLADGTYTGQFSLNNKTATLAQPIVIEGSASAIIQGGSISGGYALHISNSQYITLRGFQVSGAQKSVVFDTVTHSTVDFLTCHDCGDESILLRNFSSNNVVKNCVIYNTGLVDPGYGEGIYIGQYYGNWSSTSNPDMCDNNDVLNNTISRTAAECIDIKEGTTGGLIRANILDGTFMSGANYADSWIDIAGNGYSVTHNIGANNLATSGATHQLVDGIQTHTQPYPSLTASNNSFAYNTCGVNSTGYGINIDTSGTGNIVYTTNTASGAASGLSNVSTT